MRSQRPITAIVAGLRGHERYVAELFLFLTTGLIVGGIARVIVPGREPSGWGPLLAIGVSGSLVGGLFGRLLGMSETGWAASSLMSVLGAVALLLGYHAFVGRRAAG